MVFGSPFGWCASLAGCVEILRAWAKQLITLGLPYFCCYVTSEEGARGAREDADTIGSPILFL